MHSIILPVLAASLLIGCATTENTAEPKKDKGLFVTGSNIPRKDGPVSDVTALSREQLERQQNSSGGATTRGTEVPRF